MAVGDSFLVPTVGRSAAAVRNVVVRSKGAVKGIDGRVFATRQVEGGIRVWRVE
jgi:hypothetical protein